MSANDNTKKDTNTPTHTSAIKIASKDANQRQAEGGADPGPGDPMAAPSVAPEVVEVPAAPTASQLVVKSIATKAPADTSPSAQESTQPSSSGLSDGSPASEGQSAGQEQSPSGSGLASQSPRSAGSQTGPKSVEAAESPVDELTAAKTLKSTTKTLKSPSEPSRGATESMFMAKPATESRPSRKITTIHEPPTQAASRKKTQSRQSSRKIATISEPVSIKSTPEPKSPAGGQRKGTRFRYHKRVTVRAHGKTSPSTVMDKVTKKDQEAGLSPSTIGQMDPEELMRTAGLKAPADGKSHWRVRLRQTKRTTKGGKTITETKVAYRDSEGNKRIKSSSTSRCKRCDKKYEECRCDDPQ